MMPTECRELSSHIAINEKRSCVVQVLLTRANNQLTVSQHIRQSCKYNIVPITITFVDDALDPPTADNLQFKRFMATQ